MRAQLVLNMDYGDCANGMQASARKWRLMGSTRTQTSTQAVLGADADSHLSGAECKPFRYRRAHKMLDADHAKEGERAYCAEAIVRASSARRRARGYAHARRLRSAEEDTDAGAHASCF
jgi:hypothetical protein